MKGCVTRKGGGRVILIDFMCIVKELDHLEILGIDGIPLKLTLKSRIFKRGIDSPG